VKIETKNQNFPENLTSAAKFRLIDLILAIRVAESKVKYPTLTFSNFRHQDESEIWLLKSIEIVVHSKKSVSTKVTKEIVPFQHEFSI